MPRNCLLYRGTWWWTFLQKPIFSLKWVVSEVTKPIFGSPQIVRLVIYPKSQLVFITRFPDPKLRIRRPTSCLILGNPGLSDTNAHASWAWSLNSIEISRFPYSKVSWKHPNFYILEIFPMGFSHHFVTVRPPIRMESPVRWLCGTAWIFMPAKLDPLSGLTTQCPQFGRGWHKFGTSKGHSQSMPKCG